MWKLEIKKNETYEGHVWGNDCQDDFLRFIPDYFTSKLLTEITPAHITAYKCDINIAILNGYLSIEGNTVDTSVEGELTVKNASNEVLLTVPLKLLTQWPYDENGNFLGCQFEE